jgi:hypothetical protein
MTKQREAKMVKKLSTAWFNMRTRCLNENNKDYPRYGGRGISICKQWKDDMQSFVIWGLKTCKRINLTLDRIDNDGNYTPQNCRWATRKQQSRNTRWYHYEIKIRNPAKRNAAVVKLNYQKKRAYENAATN